MCSFFIHLFSFAICGRKNERKGSQVQGNDSTCLHLLIAIQCYTVFHCVYKVFVLFSQVVRPSEEVKWRHKVEGVLMEVRRQRSASWTTCDQCVQGEKEGFPYSMPQLCDVPTAALLGLEVCWGCPRKEGHCSIQSVPTNLFCRTLRIVQRC